MNRLILAAIVTLGAGGLAAGPATARTYDCSKAGNKTKAECKTAASAAVKVAAKPAVAAKLAVNAPAKPVAAPHPVKVATTTVTKVDRTYDCGKAGNKGKAACKTAATPTAPVVKQASTVTTTRNYDCAKAGNATKTVCKSTSVTKAVAVAKPLAMPKLAMPRPVAKPASASATVEDRNPAGAIAACKDGFFSHSKQRIGACSRHGGVARWA